MPHRSFLHAPPDVADDDRGGRDDVKRGDGGRLFTIYRNRRTDMRSSFVVTLRTIFLFIFRRDRYAWLIKRNCATRRRADFHHFRPRLTRAPRDSASIFKPVIIQLARTFVAERGYVN